MKANMKRMAGAGALAIAMMANMSFAAFAADTKEANEDTAAAVRLSVMCKLDEETGKMMISDDNGKTWKTVDIEDIKTGAEEIKAGESTAAATLSVSMAKIDEETGKPMTSNDGGETWTEFEGSFEPAADILSADAVEMTAIMVKCDEETGKMMVSADGGETWTEYDGAAAPLTADLKLNADDADGKVFYSIKTIEAK